MLLRMKRKYMLFLPESICQELKIFRGDRLHASVEDGKIILCPDVQSSRASEDLRENGRKGRILMFGSVSDAFDEADFD